MISDAANAFARRRGRPVLFLCITEFLDKKHVITVQSALTAHRFEEIDIVIHSSGGSIHAAYQIVTVLRRHAERIFACVPFYAKSAATLLCLGADEICIGELAELGPLDTQILEEKRGGKREFTSALNPFKTLEQLQRFSLETLDIAMNMIVTRSGMALDDCLKHAIQFVGCITGPLFTQLDPEKMGEYSRALAVGTEYGERLLRRSNVTNSEAIIEKLVHGYPSHEYIIDYLEIKEMGLQVSSLSRSERFALHDILHEMTDKENQNTIKLVCPNSANDVKKKGSKK